MNFNKFDNKEKAGILLFALGIFYIIFTSVVGFTDLRVWMDEIFSICAVSNSFENMIAITVGDVHPILYYLIYKFFIKFFELVGFNNVYIIGVLVSLIPMYLLMILGATKVRKNFGILTAGIFALCISSMPQFMHYAVEIRMYSWSLFFVAASFIYVYDIIRESTWKNWAILTILTICSAYTHYFSAIASFSIYFTLLIYILYKRRDLLKKWIVSVVISILAYVPWLVIAFNQISAVSQNYWIEPINFSTVLGYIYFILSPFKVRVEADGIVDPTIIGTVLLIVFVVLIGYYIKSKKTFKSNYAIWAIVVTVCLPLIGIILSEVFRPVFFPRYLVSVIGCFWLGFAILLAKTWDNKKIFLPALAIVLVVGAMGAINFYQYDSEEVPYGYFEEPFSEFSEYVKPGDIVFTEWSGTMLYSQMMLPSPHIFTGESKNIAEVIKTTLNDAGVQGEIASGSNVYLVDFIGTDYFESSGRSNFEDCVQENITLERINTTGDMIHFYKIIV